MAEEQGTPLAEHDVVVELVAHPLPALEGQLHQGVQLGQAIVGADNGRIAPGIAATDPASLQNRDLADAVHGGEIEGGSQAMTAAADDDHVIMRLGVRVPPGTGPVLVSAKTGAQQAEG